MQWNLPYNEVIHEQSLLPMLCMFEGCERVLVCTYRVPLLYQRCAYRWRGAIVAAGCSSHNNNVRLQQHHYLESHRIHPSGQPS